MSAVRKPVSKQRIEVEKLLQWAYREELPKKQTSSAEGIWDRIADYGQHGGIDPGHGAAQRYPHFGLPHPDAERIENAVGMLPNSKIDWRDDADVILGDLMALVRPRSKPVGPNVGWYYADRKPVSVELDPPSDVVVVRPLRASALVAMHAKMGTRPDWREEEPKPLFVQADRSPTGTAKIVGECRARDVYSTGSYCPVRWEPSPIAIAEARVDYLAWWRALRVLGESLQLREFQPTAPEASEMPWREKISPEVVHVLVGKKSPMLPMKPQRPPAGRTRRQGERKRYPVKKGLDKKGALR